MQRIGIVIPAYNEESVIGNVLQKLPKEITAKKIDYKIKIIVVNDCSTDKTSSVVRKMTNVTLINHLINSGAGAATRTGLRVAKELDCQYVLTMDADGQHSPEDAIKLLHAIINDEADLIIGSRLINTQGMPWYRVIGNKGLSFITFLVFGVFVGDSQSGLKALNTKALHKLTFHSNNYAFCSEIIWSAHKNKLRIMEMPVKAIYTDYSISKGQTNWGALYIIRQLIKRRLLHFIDG